MSTEQNHIPRDFVYTGQRLSGDRKTRYVSIAIICDDGALEDERWFAYHKKYDRTVGGVYTGAEFSADQVIGLANAQYKQAWSNKEDRIKWQAIHDQVEASIRLKKLETEAGRITDLEICLRDIRKLYSAYRRKNDHAGMEALEQAVLRALRTPLRITETD